MSKTVLITFISKNENVDLEIPVHISANDLVLALNQAYHLGIQTENKTLEEFGIRNGSSIYYQGE